MILEACQGGSHEWAFQSMQMLHNGSQDQQKNMPMKQDKKASWQQPQHDLYNRGWFRSPFGATWEGILLHRQSVSENCAKFDQQKNACPEFHFWWKLSTQMRPTMVCFGCSTARKRCPRGRWIGDLESKKNQMDLRTKRKLKNMSLSLQRCWNNETSEFGLRRESLFCFILHEGKTNSFRFCNTSWARMRFIGVCKKGLKWICCCNLAAPF